MRSQTLVPAARSIAYVPPVAITNTLPSAIDGRARRIAGHREAPLLDQRAAFAARDRLLGRVEVRVRGVVAHHAPAVARLRPGCRRAARCRRCRRPASFQPLRCPTCRPIVPPAPAPGAVRACGRWSACRPPPPLPAVARGRRTARAGDACCSGRATARVAYPSRCHRTRRRAPIEEHTKIILSLENRSSRIA